jgi:hypothetical protein
MLDEEITQSFDLDFEIFSTINTKYKPYSNFISSPRIESDDLLKEFENYVNVTNGILEELLTLLNNCNEQRMTFRMILIKMLKDRVVVDKILQEENDTLILKKLILHEELKNKIIDRNIETIINNENEKNKLHSRIKAMDSERKNSFSGNGSLSASTSCNTTVNYSNVSGTGRKKSSVVNFSNNVSSNNSSGTGFNNSSSTAFNNTSGTGFNKAGLSASNSKALNSYGSVSNTKDCKAVVKSSNVYSGKDLGTLKGRTLGSDKVSNKLVDKEGNKLVDKGGNMLVDKLSTALVDKVSNALVDKGSNKLFNKGSNSLVNKLGNTLVSKGSNPFVDNVSNSGSNVGFNTYTDKGNFSPGDKDVTFNTSNVNASLNNTNEDSVIKRVLNLDFNSEKYNIISSSPLQSPNNKITSSILGSNRNPTLTHANANVITPVRNMRTKSSFTKASISPKNRENIITNPNPNTNAKRQRMKKYSKSIDFDASNIYMRYNTINLNTSLNQNLENENIQDNNYIQIDTEQDNNQSQDYFNTYHTANKYNPRSRMSYNNSAKKLDFGTISSSTSNKNFTKLNTLKNEKINTFSNKNSSNTNFNKFKQGKLKSLVNSTKNYSSNNKSNYLGQSLSSFPSKDSSKNFKF